MAIGAGDFRRQVRAVLVTRCAPERVFFGQWKAMGRRVVTHGLPVAFDVARFAARAEGALVVVAISVTTVAVGADPLPLTLTAPGRGRRVTTLAGDAAMRPFERKPGRVVIEGTRRSRPAVALGKSEHRRGDDDDREHDKVPTRPIFSVGQSAQDANHHSTIPT